MDYFKTTVQGNDGSKVFACKFSRLCTFEASHTTVLMEHVKAHLDQSPFKCAYCDLRFSQLLEVKKHLLKKHKRLNFYSCLNGNCSFTMAQADSESMLNHIKDNHQFIENVPTLFQISSLNQHSISNKRRLEDLNDIYASVLGVKKQQTFSYWDNASGTMVHYGNVVSSNAVDSQQSSFSCSYKNCFYKSYNSWIELKEHEYNFHMKLSFRCTESSCIETIFETKDSLNQHFIERHGFSPFCCGIDDCNRLFDNR